MWWWSLYSPYVWAVGFREHKHPSLAKFNKITFEKVSWSDETKVEVSGHNSKKYVCWKKQHWTEKISRPRVKPGGATSGFGAVFLQLEPGPCSDGGKEEELKKQLKLVQTLQASARKHDYDPKQRKKGFTRTGMAKTRAWTWTNHKKSACEILNAC